MTAFGETALPVLVVDGDIAIHGRYPSREELAGVLSVNAEPVSSSRRAQAVVAAVRAVADEPGCT
jgi:hypothetical protein